MIRIVKNNTKFFIFALINFVYSGGIEQIGLKNKFLQNYSQNFLAHRFNQRGAMAMSSILALSMILLALGLAMTYSGFIQTDMAYNQDKAAIAFYVAEAGAKDAMQKIVRDKNYYNDAGYDLVLTNGSAHVVVSKDVPIAERTQIISTGVVGANTKKIKVILNTDADNNDNGRITIVSWEELGS